MVFRQTVLLGKQTEIQSSQVEIAQRQTEIQVEQVEQQTVLAEMQQRSGYTAELHSVLQALSLADADTLSTESRTGTDSKLRRGLIARIVAFSLAAEPYRIIEFTGAGSTAPTSRPADRLRSPERGQLLIALLLAGVDISALQGVTFGGADLRRAKLSGARLAGADLRDADLSGARLAGADLREADLSGARLAGADLTEADLSATRFINADLRNADLRGAWVKRVVPPAQAPDGWDHLPSGWELFDEQGRARFRQSSATPP
jgi:hypothetical protein